MPEEKEYLPVRSQRNDDRTVLCEQSRLHPDEWAHVAGKTPTLVGRTPLVARLLLTEGFLEEVPAKEYEEYLKKQQEKDKLTVMQNAIATPQVMEFVAGLQNQMTEMKRELDAVKQKEAGKQIERMEAGLEEGRKTPGRETDAEAGEYPREMERDILIAKNMKELQKEFEPESKRTPDAEQLPADPARGGGPKPTNPIADTGQPKRG